MKRVIKGWIGKSDKVLPWWRDIGQGIDILEAGEIYKTKGEENSWPSNDWPPKRVLITIEVEE